MNVAAGLKTRRARLKPRPYEKQIARLKPHPYGRKIASTKCETPNEVTQGLF
jgi:hypothetical protein